jgi:hypothetical protein
MLVDVGAQLGQDSKPDIFRSYAKMMMAAVGINDGSHKPVVGGK